MDRILVAMLALMSICQVSCSPKDEVFGEGDIRIMIEKGSGWRHKFPLFLGIGKMNSPQIAIWAEDTSGNYISTVYVTESIARQSWMMARGNRRIEALPHWCHSRGVVYGDGLLSPTREEPLPDAFTGATPRGSFTAVTHIPDEARKFVIKVEVNHSVDFNSAYPASAMPGDPGYSGGREGSGQPALVYAATVDRDSGHGYIEACLLGHSSPGFRTYILQHLNQALPHILAA